MATDTVFAVKDDLVVDFKPLKGDDQAELELNYNVILAPKDYKVSVLMPRSLTGKNKEIATNTNRV